MLNEEDEYSLHHEFSQFITKADENSISLIVDFLLRRGNPFDTSYCITLINIVTNTDIDKESEQFLLNCVSIGSEACKDFIVTRVEQKTSKLLDTIPKTRKSTKVKETNVKLDVKKETVAFMRNVDYARLRGFNIRNLLQYELATTSFFLTKDGFLRNPQKAELVTETKKLFNGEFIDVLPPMTDQRMVVIDFMGYARKMPTKQMKLK